MTVRVGINGFGRIGRQSLKAIMERVASDPKHAFEYLARRHSTTGS